MANRPIPNEPKMHIKLTAHGDGKTVCGVLKYMITFFPGGHSLNSTEMKHKLPSWCILQMFSKS